METVINIAPEIAYYMQLVKSRMAGKPDAKPTVTGLSDSKIEAVGEILTAGHPFDITGWPEDAIPDKLQTQKLYGPDALLRPRIISLGLKSAGYDGVELIDRFKGQAAGNIAGLAEMFPGLAGGRRLAALYAVAMLIRYLDYRSPEWLRPIYNVINDGFPPDEEIALAYAGGAIAIEADRMKEENLHNLAHDTPDSYQATVMEKVDNEAGLFAMMKLGLPMTPKDLGAVEPAHWVHIIESLYNQFGKTNNE